MPQRNVLIGIRPWEVHQTAEISVHHDTITKITPLLMRVRKDALSGWYTGHDHAAMLSIKRHDIPRSNLLAISISHD